MEGGMERDGMAQGIGDNWMATCPHSRPTSTRDILYKNACKGNFEDATIGAGLDLETRSIGWGACPVDLDFTGRVR